MARKASIVNSLHFRMGSKKLSNLLCVLLAMISKADILGGEEAKSHDIKRIVLASTIYFQHKQVMNHDHIQPNLLVLQHDNLKGPL